MKKTLREVNIFIVIANDYAGRNPARTKLTYALSRMAKRLQPHLTEYQEAVEDAAINNCLVDDKGAIISSEAGAFTFTKEGMTARNKTIRDLLSKSIEFEPFYVGEVPDDLTDGEVTAFEGFVLREEQPEPELSSNGQVVKESLSTP